jgi:hypothetical protein
MFLLCNSHHQANVEHRLGNIVCALYGIPYRLRKWYIKIIR